jgi:molybdate/tungstate transport system ATP-binding protein
MIELNQVAIQVGEFQLKEISFQVEAGTHAMLMGQTGQGKTTILEAICGLRPVASGTIRLNGRDVTKLKPAERNIGYVPQDLVLFPTMTVQEQLSFAIELRRVPKAKRRKRVEELSELLGINHLLPRKTAGLSGGESQRVALGRALSFEPDILLLDEPFSALDETTRKSMHELLQTIQGQTPVTTLHVTHNRSEADALADMVLVLEDQTVQTSPAKMANENSSS